MKRLATLLLLVGGVGLALTVAGYAEATRAPAITRFTVKTPTLAANQQAIRIALLSDIHVAGPDMPPARLARIVAQTNALRPDLIVLTGDYVSDKGIGSAVPTAAAIAPLSSLKARFGVFAVPGNHDHWRGIGGFRAAFARAGIPLLFNASQAAGPLKVAGVDDELAGQPDLAAALAGTAGDRRPVILLSHSPDIFPKVPAHIALTLAGHTHGGQIAPPLIGPLATASRYGRRYARGLIVENGRPLVVSAGLGTSILPLRFGVPPEIVLVTLVPAVPRQ